MTLKKIGVVGAGIMGSGIAQICAQAGYEVIMRDIDTKFLEKGMDAIQKSLSKFVEKGKIKVDEKKSILSRIKTTLNLSDLSDVDYIIEAIPEDLELKKKLFAELDNICQSNTIFGTNTSSLSITELASATKRADRFIGIHFFNPPQLMKLVEIIRGYQTSDETFDITKQLCIKLGKDTTLSNDYPGFVTTRMVALICNEACWMLYEGVASKEDIDNAIKLGLNHPMGPLALADLIGLDTVLNILNRLYTGFNDMKYRPCPLLKNLVAAGNLGRKTKSGFWKYD
jgi:3-hydroxybutyryl-CoA dehydrogenase